MITNTQYYNMKSIVLLIALTIVFNCDAQSLSLGANISPTLDNSRFTTFAPSLQFELKHEDLSLFVSASNEKLVIGLFLGNVFEVGIAYKTFIGDSKNYLQLGVRVNKELKNGYNIQIGSFVDIGLVNSNLVTYIPVQIGITKTII